ncbi:hypothetical protein EBU24_01995 [bacterium]|nr:hypothetical protein [bacterium]
MKIKIIGLLLLTSFLLKSAEKKQENIRRSQSFNNLLQAIPAQDDQNAQKNEEENAQRLSPALLAAAHLAATNRSTALQSNMKIHTAQLETITRDQQHIAETNQEESPNTASENIHETTLEEIVRNNHELLGSYQSNDNLREALEIHRKLTEIQEEHTPESFLQQAAPYVLAGTAATAAYFFCSSDKTKKLRTESVIAPLLIIGAGVGALMWLRNWFNEDKFKALDSLKDAQAANVKTAYELTLLKKQILKLEESNQILLKRVAPCEESMKQILEKIQSISQITGDHAQLATIESLIIGLCKLNAERHNALVHHLIPHDQQKDFLIQTGHDEKINNQKNDQTDNTIMITQHIEAQTKQTSSNTARQGAPLLSAQISATKLNDLIKNDQDLQKAQDSAIKTYCKKHSLWAEWHSVKEIGYLAIPQEWREKHYRNIEDYRKEHTSS